MTLVGHNLAYQRRIAYYVLNEVKDFNARNKRLRLGETTVELQIYDDSV